MSKETTKKDNTKVTCRYCKEKLYKQEAIQHKPRSYYHANCLEKFKTEEEDKTKQKKQKNNDYRDLIAYICEDLYKIKRPTGMMMQQIKRFKEEYGYTDKGIELTLRYFYEVLDNKVDDKTGLGIVPWIYEDATQQYINKIKVKNSFDDEQMKTKEVNVSISTKHTKREKNLIDIDSL